MDDQDIDRNTDEDNDDERRGPVFSFDDTASLPHWSEPATGEIPKIPEGGQRAGGSRLFPQLPDDPRIAEDESPSGIDVGPSLVDGIDDLAPTGPIESIIPSIPADDLPTPRWAEPKADSPDDDQLSPSEGRGSIPGLDSVPDLEDSADQVFASDDWVGESATPDGSGEAETRGLFEPSVPIEPMSDQLDQLLDIGLDEDEAGGGYSLDEDEYEDEADSVPFVAVEPEPPAVDTGPLPIVDVGEGRFGGPAPHEPDEGVPSAEPTPDVALVAPVEPAFVPSEAPPQNAPASGGDGEDELAAWSVLDQQAPLWREGAKDWGDHDSSDSAERTVLHFDDGTDDGGPPAPSGGRNMPVAIATAATLVAAFLFLVDRGPGWAMLLVVPLLVMAASEFFMSVRHVGYRPATLLGLVSVAGLSLAAYFEGIAAIPLVLVLTTVFSLLWFLFGVDHDRPAANISVTLFGVLWVGLLGSFVPLILEMPHGSGILFGAIIGTATYDTAGLFIGRATGQSRLAPHISPNKTYEGLIGGMIFAVLVVTFGLGIWPGLMPWSGDSQLDALLLGIVVAVMAPLGDLAQSLIKRDLGVKDMGTALPGHGGVFDRFDAMLFVLPAVYYLALARDLHLGL